MSTERARRRETQIHLLPLPPRGEASGGSDPDVVPLTEVVGWAGCAQAGSAPGAGSSRGPGCLWFSGGWRIVSDLWLKHKSVWGLSPHPCTPPSPYQVTRGEGQMCRIQHAPWQSTSDPRLVPASIPSPSAQQRGRCEHLWQHTHACPSPPRHTHSSACSPPSLEKHS